MSAAPVRPTPESPAGGTPPGDDELLAAAVALSGGRVAVLTGAGISTESGIPDYRGAGTRARARRPMRFSEFTSGDDARRRYWARATAGWPRVRDAVPNAAHRALAELEARGRVAGVITQNVDGLHGAAGSRRVVELHGALRDVACLACGAISAREDVHARLLASNPRFAAALAPDGASPDGAGPDGARPDGDVELAGAVVDAFVPVGCAACGGALKPRVVFFGERVPAAAVAEAWRVLDEAAALLVVGSSLEVFSGRRFVEEAARRKMPVVIVNATATRADALATVVVRGRAGAVLPALAR